MIQRISEYASADYAVDRWGDFHDAYNRLPWWRLILRRRIRRIRDGWWEEAERRMDDEGIA